MKLLVVEDNQVLIDRIKRTLQKNYLVDTATDGKEAIEKASVNDYNVILLDLGLPDMTGLEVCKKIRKQPNDTPILILSGEDDVLTKVHLLEHGADDYVTKPFNAGELRARINALGRRQPLQPKKHVMTFRDVVIDSEERTVFRAGVPITLRRKEFDILEYLIANAGRVLTRDMIMSHAWTSSKSSYDSTVDVHIKHLRDKIDRPFKTPIIKTAYGLGYKVEVPGE